MSTTFPNPNTPVTRQVAQPAGDQAALFSVELLPSTDRQQVLGWWQQLEAELGESALTCSHTWTKTWLEHYGDWIPHRFIVGKSGDHVVGLALLTEGVGQKVGPFRLKTLHVGTAGEPAADAVCVEYNQILVSADHRNDFVRATMTVLDQDSSWDELRLDGFLSEDVTAFTNCKPATESRDVASHYFDLKSARDQDVTTMSCFGYATRKNIRKNLKSYGDLEPEWAKTLEQAQEIFDEMVELHQARWQSVGEPGSYASQRFSSFHRDLLQQLFPAGQVGLFRLKCEGDTIGCVQFFIDRKHALVYQGGSAPYEAGRKSPGMMVDVACIEACCQHGLDSYDFLGGESHHKQKLTTDSNQLSWVVYRRFRWKFVLVNLARSIRNRCKRTPVETTGQE